MEFMYKGKSYKDGDPIQYDFKSNVYEKHCVGKIIFGLYEDEYRVYTHNHIGFYVVDDDGDYCGTLPDVIDKQIYGMTDDDYHHTDK